MRRHADMEVEVFKAPGAEHLRVMLGRWLADHPDAKVEHVGQSSTPTGDVIVTVFYTVS
jgi:hypothetical protein